jgi:hypothetical protein
MALNSFRTKQEKMMEVRPIMEKLREMDLKPSEHPELRELYSNIQDYLSREQSRIFVNIPFPAINKKILGVLASRRREKVFVKLEHMK